jgi:hypothetical protein
VWLLRGAPGAGALMQMPAQSWQQQQQLLCAWRLADAPEEPSSSRGGME